MGAAFEYPTELGRQRDSNAESTVTCEERGKKMSINYLTGALLALFSGFVVVANQAFPADVLSWVAFGIGVAIICITVLAQLDRSRGWPRGAWTLPHSLSPGSCWCSRWSSPARRSSGCRLRSPSGP